MGAYFLMPKFSRIDLPCLSRFASSLVDSVQVKMSESSPTPLPEPPTGVSLRFSDPTADVVFVSSDNIIFRIHRAYLSTTTAGFAVPPLISSDDSPVKLTEPSEVLEILFQFIQSCSAESGQYRQPSVMTMTPENLFAVAEAAEKYIVFGAMNTFITRMNHTEIWSRYPIEVLNHCAKHGYDDLACLAAHKSLSFPLDQIVEGLTHPGLLAKWLLYYNRWLLLARTVQGDIGGPVPNKCERLAYIKMRHLTRTMADISLAIDASGCFPGKTVPCNTGLGNDCSCRKVQLTYDKPSFSL